jgi:D-alanyl-D-alanine carboxypeptidase/D-alanyl-D-alanine-endopeptidase (penicillin-binding protein 4)
MRAAALQRLALPRLAQLLQIALVVALLAPSTATAALDDRVNTAVRRSGVASSTSVYVWDQATRQVLYSRAASRQVTPASTIKLLTGAAALERFGPDHRFTTRVALTGTQQGARWVGDVWIIGGGDPSLSTFGFARDNYGGRGANLAALVNPLRARGIEVVDGDIRVDDDLFDELRWVPEWKRSFRLEETGALGALTVNQSLVGRWIGTDSSHLPDVHAGETYRELLRRQDIQVTGVTRPGAVPVTARLAGAVSSPPLSELVAHMSSSSDNFFAEILLKQVGVDRFGAAGDGSTLDGRRAARAELVELGIDMTGVRWIDGSGLAYDNRVTARSLGHVLGVGAQATWGETWIGGFANNGRSGTLRRRMTRRPYYGRVYGKTGTLRHASGLAGFAHRVGSNRRLGFAVLTQDPRGGQLQYDRTRALQDRIAMILVR